LLVSLLVLIHTQLPPPMLLPLHTLCHPRCLVSNDALLQYMQYSRPFGSSVAILLGYLGVVHVLTFVGMLLLANKEAR
jgi:MFS-type transporter involved in bile tolerance (Atg22 family)